ncbi:hypothetical protein QCA50_016059 [Cerrena zonata]|uniref:Uncharacterized protein n=1 Tax=Cerrena zonata TaxID=2478898 RepID=A0AAW0FJG7_9APHY
MLMIDSPSAIKFVVGQFAQATSGINIDIETDEQTHAELEAHIVELKRTEPEQAATHQRERRVFEQELAQLQRPLTESDALL